MTFTRSCLAFRLSDVMRAKCTQRSLTSKGFTSEMTTILRVRARAGLVPDFENLKANPPIYIGREWCKVDGNHALRARVEPTTIPARAEYVRAVREGALEPCDEATAAACGVAWTPTPTPTPKGADDAQAGIET